MTRIALYLAGISAAVAALTVYRSRLAPTRRVPVQEAAERLRQAWADHHTVA